MDRSESRLLVNLLACATLLHAGLFIFDLAHPEVFLHADRATTRMRTIDALAGLIREREPLGSFFALHGIVGDYLPQALLYLLGGRPAIVVGQILLFLISLAALFSLTLALTRSRNCAGLVALLYLLLPHSLVFPHMLCSEAIFDPLVIISFYFTGRVMLDGHRSATAGWSGVVLGLATLVRPITALWPFLVGIAMRLGKCSWTSLASFMILSFLPLLIWMSIIQYLSGTFSLGSSDHDAGHNMYERVARISQRLPPPEQITVKEKYLREDGEKVMSVRDFVRFAAEYPGPYLVHLGKDGVVYFAKSGVEKLLLDYLNVDPSARAVLQDQQSGYRSQMASDGVMRTVQRILSEHPTLMLGSLFGAVLFVGLLGLATLGAWRAVIDRAWSINARLMLGLVTLFPFYVFLTSQLVTAMQSRHRAPAEFCICLLAAIGLRYLVRCLPRNRQTSVHPTVTLVSHS